MDFSEIDIWWLLNRRLREKSGHGKIYFLEEKNLVKQEIIKKFDITHIDLGFKEKPENFSEFYNLAFEKIKELMEGKEK